MTLSILIYSIYGLLAWSSSAMPISANDRSHFRIQQKDGRYFSYQNTDGQFHLGNWTLDGVVTGHFGWLDNMGIKTALHFIADDKGYRIVKKPTIQSNKTKKVKSKSIGIIDDPIGDIEHTIIANKFDYATSNLFRVEQKRKTGLIYGKYGFIDATGRLIVVHYTTHARRGFLVNRQVFDPRHGQSYTITDIFKLPLRDVAAEFNLKEYYRSVRE